MNKKVVSRGNVQSLACPKCDAEFSFDPNDDSNNIGTFKPKLEGIERKVSAYLTCPNGHTTRHLVKKIY